MTTSLNVLRTLEVWTPVGSYRSQVLPAYCRECGRSMQWQTATAVTGMDQYDPATGAPHTYQYYTCPRRVRMSPRWKFWKAETRPCWWSGDIRRREILL